MARIRWEVRPAGGPKICEGYTGGWVIARGDTVLERWHRKARAVEQAASRCRAEWEASGQLSELTIKRRDGTIQDKRTYGRDPRSTKG